MDNIFPKRLRQIREIEGLKQEEFAQKIGISRASLSYYENGTRTPDISILTKIYEATGASIYYLLGITDSITDHYQASQEDSGLSSEALAILSSEKLYQAVINHLVCSYWFHMFAYEAAIVHDDILHMSGKLKEEWPSELKSMRDSMFNYYQQQLTMSAIRVFCDESHFSRSGLSPLGARIEDLPSEMPVDPVERTDKFLRVFCASPHMSQDEGIKRIENKIYDFAGKWFGKGMPKDAQETPEQ